MFTTVAPTPSTAAGVAVRPPHAQAVHQSIESGEAVSTPVVAPSSSSQPPQRSPLPPRPRLPPVPVSVHTELHDATRHGRVTDVPIVTYPHPATSSGIQTADTTPQLAARSAPPPLLPKTMPSGTTEDPPAVSSAVLSSAVALRFRCKNLTSRDLLSQSDPFIVVSLEDTTRNPTKWREIGRTETAENRVDLSFIKVIPIDYAIDRVQRLRLDVFDRDSSSEELSAHDFLGCAELTMAQLMATTDQSLELPLQQSDDRKRVRGLKGSVCVEAEELSTGTDQFVTIQFGADKLDNKDGWFGKSDPYLAIWRLKTARADPDLESSWIPVWSSELVMNNLNPRWTKTTISVRALCNGDLQVPLVIRCYDWQKNGRHQVIGHCAMTADELICGERLAWDLINPAMLVKKGNKYVNSGVLRILSVSTTTY